MDSRARKFRRVVSMNRNEVPHVPRAAGKREDVSPERWTSVYESCRALSSHHAEKNAPALSRPGQRRSRSGPPKLPWGEKKENEYQRYFIFVFGLVLGGIEAKFYK